VWLFWFPKAIRDAKVVAFKDLGMEALHAFTVVDMPVIVAVDANGNSIHTSSPNRWRRELAAQLT
jgi:fumarate hydratase class I